MTALDVAHVSDIYPSRNGKPDAIIERKDPVVYSSQPDNSPVAYDLIKKYEQNGFLIINNIFSDGEIRCFQDELERLRDAPEIRLKDEAIIEPGSGEVRSVFAVHNISPVFKKLASDRRLAAIAEYILGDHVYIHQSRVNYKPGFRGKEFYWHSDFETWHVEDGMPRMRALSMSIILTDNYEYNGPLLLIPKSHLDFVICSEETPANHFKRSLKKQEYGIPCDNILEKLIRRSGIFAATGNSGSVIISIVISCTGQTVISHHIHAPIYFWFIMLLKIVFLILFVINLLAPNGWPVVTPSRQ